MKSGPPKGITVFISSHLLSEIEKLCTHVGITHQGELKFEGTKNQSSSDQVASHSVRIQAGTTDLSLGDPFTIKQQREGEIA